MTLIVKTLGIGWRVLRKTWGTITWFHSIVSLSLCALHQNRNYLTRETATLVSLLFVCCFTGQGLAQWFSRRFLDLLRPLVVVVVDSLELLVQTTNLSRLVLCCCRCKCLFLTQLTSLQMVLSKLMRQCIIQSGRMRAFSSQAHEGGHHANPELWRKIWYFVCIPAITLSMINTYLEEKEHWEHYTRPEFVPMEYLRIRNKKFPWGDGNHTLFHNPLVNPLPTGWEPLPEHLQKYDRKPEGGSHH